MWVSLDVFSWHPWNSMGTSIDVLRWKRPYDLHAHGEQLALAAASQLSIGDAVGNLKRAIQIRLQHLEELYRLKPCFPRIPGALERLELVGLARPFLIRELIELRNDIEHKDAPPPSAARCRELADLTWYFLKSTDAVCKYVPDTLELTEYPEGPAGDGEGGWFEIEVKPLPQAELKARGWIPLLWLSDSERSGWIPANVHTRDATRGDGELHVIGHIVPTIEQRQRIMHLLIASV